MVEGKKEMVALAIRFDDAAVPMGYKIRLNDFLATVRADNRVQNPQGENKAQVPPAAQSAQAPKPEAPKEEKPAAEGQAAPSPAAAQNEPGK
jgi:hypothetical protein